MAGWQVSMTVAERNRLVRREALKEQISARRHYQEMNAALDRMTDLAEGPMDFETRERFAMFAALADRHWRVVSKYLPPPAEFDETSIKEIRRVIVRPAMRQDQAVDLLK